MYTAPITAQAKNPVTTAHVKVHSTGVKELHTCICHEGTSGAGQLKNLSRVDCKTWNCYQDFDVEKNGSTYQCQWYCGTD